MGSSFSDVYFKKVEKQNKPEVVASAGGDHGNVSSFNAVVSCCGQGCGLGSLSCEVCSKNCDRDIKSKAVAVGGVAVSPEVCCNNVEKDSKSVDVVGGSCSDEPSFGDPASS